MRLRKIAIIACSMLAATFCATAALAEETTNTWWVAKEDPNAANTLDEGRGSEALPFRTIQAALDNPDFRAGDIVLVKRGDYDEGEYRVAGDYNMTNRVYISKAVHLKAVDGRDVTRIVGKWGTNGASDSSADGIRCIYVAAAAAGTEIEGFTLMNGYAYGSGAGGANGTSYTRDRNFGGGIYVASKLKTVYVIDCAFRNCLACMGPAITGGTLIRCVIYGCRSVLARSDYATGPHMLYSSYAFGCVVTKSSGKITTYMLDGTSVAVNCTFHDNSCASLSPAETYGSGYAYNCIFAANTAQSEYPEGKLVDSYVSTTSTNMAFATGFYDYRLPTDSPAIGTGNTAHRQVLDIPAKYLEKDFNGATIDWTAESFNPGASQGTAEPTTAVIKFKGDALVNNRCVYTDMFIRSERFPENFTFAPADQSQTFCCFTRTTESGGPKYPRPNKVYIETNGIARVILPRRASMAYMEYTPRYAAAEIWVDPTSAGSDEDGDGSEEHPYHTLQYAVDQVGADYTVIHAKRGDYREGGAVRDGIMTRVDLYRKANVILLKSVDGPDVTTIWGAADPETVNDETETGCGTNAVRCVCGRATYSAVQGFTLRDGHTLATNDPSSGDADADSRARDGAAVATGSDSFWSVPPMVMDCIITNCVSAGSLIRTTFSTRCLIIGNTAYDTVFHCGYQAANLVLNNSCVGIFGKLPSNSGRAWMVTAVGNTLVAGSSSFDDWGASWGVHSSIIDGGRVATSGSPDIGNVVWNQSSVSKLASTSVNADPIFADKGAGDYRPAIGGPAVDYATATNMPLFCFYLGSDCYGNPLRISADGKLTSGCVQGNLPYKVSVSASSGGAGFLVDGESGDKVAAVEDGTVFTLAADTNCVRYAKGYMLNGVEHLFDSYPGSVTLQIDGEPCVVEAIESTEWHVDAVDGNDATGNGFTPATAKRTLAEVFTNCAVTAGDTVYAHPGTYSNGEMRISATEPHASRVIVPANVTLKATGSAEETIILGAASDSEFANAYGMGTNAVRCAALGANALLEGFTLTGGRTTAKSSLSGDTAYRDFNCVGGGVAGVDRNTTALVRDCVISNNFGLYGGGGIYCRYQKCRVLSNNATTGSGGGIYRAGMVRDCFLDKNDGTYIVMYSDPIYNCTIGYNNKGYSTYYYQPAAEAYKVFNSIVYRPGNKQSVYWNCALGNNWTAVPEEYLLHGTISTNVAALNLDENLKPTKDSLVVDAGDDEKRGSLFPETDLDGVPRVLNGGRFDIGAYEYDWRKEYSKTLGKHVEVTDVTSNVVEAVDAVRVPEGTLSLEWQVRDGCSPTFNAVVEGEGVLSIVLDGDAFASLDSGDGAQTFTLPADVGTRILDFQYSGDGYAELSGFKRSVGSLIRIK